MASIIIDGINMPEPISCSVTFKHKNSSGSGPSETANLFVERVKSNIPSIDIIWRVRGSDAKTIADALTPGVFSVTFVNPKISAIDTQDFTTAGYNCALLQYDGVNTLWLISATLTQEV